MKRLKNLVLAFCAGFALSACSSFGEGMDVDVRDLTQIPPSQSVDLIAKNQMGSAPVRVDPAMAITHNTDGRVQIFGLDDAGVGEAFLPSSEGGVTKRAEDGVAPPRAVSFSGSASPVFSGDPSVQVFSLDGDAPEGGASYGPARVSGYSSVPGSGKAAGVTVIYFGHDSHALSPEALGAIARVSKAFDPALGQGIDVEGHASVTANYVDDAQRKIVNLKISMDRAMAVFRELIKQGVPAEAIRVTAWGEVRPPRQLDGKTPEEAARRVEISGQGLM